MAKIEVCVSNLALGSDEVCRKVQATFPNVTVHHWGCLGYCHVCFQQPAILIDDTTYLQGETAEELWEKVKEFLEEQQSGGPAAAE